MKVLIVRVGAMGDVLHALPAASALRAARPDWEIDWVVDPRWANLLVDGEEGDAERVGPVVTRVALAETRLWKSRPWSWATVRSVMKLRRELRARRYDLVVDMQGTLRSAVIGWMAGGKVVAGYADPREAMAARFYSKKIARRGVHVIEQGAALLGEAVGVELEAGVFGLPRIRWAEEWAEEEAVIARPLCVLGAGGGWGAKLWPVERYGELAKELRAAGFDVVVNSPSKADTVATRVVEASGGAARRVGCNVAGLVALLRRTDLFVGGDTGPMHLAVALAVPTVALFGPTDPKRNGPFGVGNFVVLRDEEAVTSYKRSQEVDAGLARLPVPLVMSAVEVVVGAGESKALG
jgi:heptosyltransferase-1